MQMNTLASVFLIQLALSAALFVMLYYFITVNASLKEEIEAGRQDPTNRTKG